MDTHMPEGEATHSNQVCFEKATLQVAPTSLAAEHSEVLLVVELKQKKMFLLYDKKYNLYITSIIWFTPQEKTETTALRPLENFSIAAKPYKRLEDELDKKNKELEQCRKRLKEEEQKVKHYQRKALIYKAHILHMRKLYGITPKQLW